MKPKCLTKRQAGRVRFRNGKLLPSSRVVYSDSVKAYFNYLVQNKLGDDFNIDNISDWLNMMTNSNTYNIRLQGIKEFYYKEFEHHSDRDRLRMREAFESLRRRMPQQAKLQNLHYLSSKQVTILCKKITPRMALITEALFWTGCRISELINIRLSDCQVGECVTIMVFGKGAEYGYVYMPVTLYNSIRAMFSGSVYLFETYEGRPFSRVFVSLEMRRQSIKRFDLPVHPHMLRHSKAMFLRLERRLSLDQIAKAMRHKRPITTGVYYMHDTPDPKAQGIPMRSKIKKEA